MVDVSVALTWVAISGISLKWLSVFGRTAAPLFAQSQTNDEDPLLEEIYPLELFPAGGPRLRDNRRYPVLPVLAVIRETPAADVDVANT